MFSVRLKSARLLWLLLILVSIVFIISINEFQSGKGKEQKITHQKKVNHFAVVKKCFRRNFYRVQINYDTSHCLFFFTSRHHHCLAMCYADPVLLRSVHILYSWSLRWGLTFEGNCTNITNILSNRTCATEMFKSIYLTFCLHALNVLSFEKTFFWSSNQIILVIFPAAFFDSKLQPQARLPRMFTLHILQP